MKILVCHDGSKNAQDALEKTIAFFGALKPEIILLSVVEESRSASSESENIFDSEKQDRKSVLVKIAEGISKKGIKAETLIYVGGPKKTILKVAEAKQPDFIVVARRGSENILQKMYGSISEFLIQYSKYPVIVFQEHKP